MEEDDDDVVYVIYDSTERRDEIPPKRRRRSGREALAGRVFQNIPSGQDAETSSRSGSYERDRSVRTSSSSEQTSEFAAQIESSGDYEPPLVPSTSRSKESCRKRKIAPEETEFKYRYKSSSKSYAKHSTERSHDYEFSAPSTSSVVEHHREVKTVPEDLGFEDIFRILESKQKHAHRSYSSAYSSERSHDHNFAKASTPAARGHHEEYKTNPEAVKFRSKHKSFHGSYSSVGSTEKSHDYKFPSLPSTSSATQYHKEYKVKPEIESHTSSGHSISVSTSSSKEFQKEQKIVPEVVSLKCEQKSSEKVFFPMRPETGKQGRHIEVVSNLYPIEFPTGYVYHYDVEIIDNKQYKQLDDKHKKYRCLNTKINREVIAFMLNNHPDFKGFCCAFDGQKNLLAKEELRMDLPFTCSVMLPSKNPYHSQNRGSNNFKVGIKSLVSRINLDSIRSFYKKRSNDLPQDAITALETILRHSPCLNYTPIGRCFYNSDNATPFGGGLEIWFGYHQSIRLSQWKPTVNLNISATTFWKSGPVLNYIADYMNMRVSDLCTLKYLDRNDRRRINQKLRQKQVKVTHMSYGRKYRILKLRDLSANEEYVVDKSGKIPKMTVAQYFKYTYGKDLKYGNLPCVQVKPEEKNIFIPIEVCEFTERQHYRGDITPALKSKMVQFTSKSPSERFNKIKDIVRKVNFNEDETVRGFGLKVSNHPLIADARVLDSPNLVYKDRYNSDKEILPENGQWHVRNVQFLKGAKISKWVLLSFERNHSLNGFVDQLQGISKNLGLYLGKPSIIIKNIDSDKSILFYDLKKEGYELAVIVLPMSEEKYEKKLYAEIKTAAETAVGLPTQCIKAEKLQERFSKHWPQIATNLCLKINAKLGGENHSLLERDISPIMYKPVMIIGADVNHPPPTQLNQPSIAACVGSVDSIGKRFAVSIRLQVNSNEQKKKVEKICDLEDMVYDLLLAFYKHTKGQKPEKIIFYRDGVSEGELLMVKREEITSIRKACLRHEKEYKPGITAIVVQKRHQVRFKPYRREDEVRPKGNNIPPGTVIDSEVTHPQNFDFFLCSQFGLQGTSRPSHYLVIEDDNNFSADDLQKLTFQMCHMYVRCTKSISIPAPVAYADLVAYRARKHLESSQKDESSSDSDCSLTYRLSEQDMKAIKVVEDLERSMYFV